MRELKHTEVTNEALEILKSTTDQDTRMFQARLAAVYTVVLEYEGLDESRFTFKDGSEIRFRGDSTIVKAATK